MKVETFEVWQFLEKILSCELRLKECVGFVKLTTNNDKFVAAVFEDQSMVVSGKIFPAAFEAFGVKYQPTSRELDFFITKDEFQAITRIICEN